MQQRRMTAKNRIEFGKARESVYNHEYYLEVIKPRRTELNRKRKYGLTPEAFKEMLTVQDNRCGICRITEPRRGWTIDHCHTTGVIRGILCNPCNSVLGLARDNPETLERAVSYIRANKFVPDSD